jgi:SH3-like domain-containing protein
MQAQNQINRLKSLTSLGYTHVLLGLFSLVFSFSAIAVEYRSVVPTKTVSYDAPSKEATKLYLLGSGYPVEIIVNLGEWLKVRDQLGSLSWVESKSLSTKRMALVLAKTDIKSSEDINSHIFATVEKDVVLELVSPSIKNGWVKVKHRDGIIGYVQVVSLWGVN